MESKQGLVSLFQQRKIFAPEPEIAGLIVTKKAELESLLEEEPFPIHVAEKLKVVIRILEEYQKMLTPLFEEGERKDGLVVNAEAHAKELEEQYTKTLHEQEALVEELRKALDPNLKDQIAELGEAVDQKDRDIPNFEKIQID